MHRTLSLAATATAVTTIPGVPVAATPGSVRWGPCSERAAAAKAAELAGAPASPTLDCATLEVPLDYRNPHGRQIEIAISRLASQERSRRRGVLLTCQ